MVHDTLGSRITLSDVVGDETAKKFGIFVVSEKGNTSE